jgi:hypothetical protein
MMFQEDVGQAIDRGFAKVPDAPFIEQLIYVFGVMLKQNSGLAAERRRRRCDGLRCAR